MAQPARVHTGVRDDFRKIAILKFMKNERLLIWLGFMVISIVWGSTWLVIKIGLQSISPLLGAGLRFSVASAVLLLIIKFRRLSIPFNPEARKVYLALGLLSFGIPFGLVYWGQQFIPSSLSSILFAAYPFWVAVFSHLMLREERLDIYKIVGVTVGFLGLVVIFAGDLHWSENGSLLGAAAVVCSTVLQAYSLVLIKKYGKPINPFVMNFVGMSVGCLILLGLGLFLEADRPINWNGSAIGSILYLGIVGSVLAFGTYFWLLKRIEAVYLSLTSFINPVVAVILGAIVLGEALNPAVFAGATLVLIGILAANGRYMHAKIRTSLW